MPLYRPLLVTCLFINLHLTFGVVVQTTYGPVQGNVTTYNSQSLRSFLGIPYAKPPIGQLRFKPPQDPESWTKLLVATEYSPVCMQQELLKMSLVDSPPMSEDCLYLNVFVPVTTASGSLPVMVWVHGGGLEGGSAQDISPHGLAMYGELIVVTINYRLGVFGFFTTGSDAAEGNVGMLDQVAALKWVRDNIAVFGGDTNRITIFGESAGAWSVTAHLISPLSSGLFHRVIAQSGSIQNFHLETAKERMVSSEAFVNGLGCAAEDENEMLRCLQNATADEVMSQSLLTPYTSSLLLSVGGSFLPLQPEVMWSTYTPSADLMIGVNSEEASLNLQILELFLPPVAYDAILRFGISTEEPVFDGLLEWSLSQFTSQIPQETLSNIVMAQYFGNLEKDDRMGTLRAVLDAGADRIIISPSLLTAKSTVASGRDVYMYYFSEVTKTPALGEVLPLFFPYVAALDSGAGHATEIPYAVGMISTPNIPYSMFDLASEEDRNISLSMMNAWSSFAKTGKPVFLSSDGSEVELPQYQSDDKRYVEFKSPMSADSVKTNLRVQAENFWNVMLPAVIDQYQENPATTNGPDPSTTECPGPNQSNDQTSLTHRKKTDITLLVLIASGSVLIRCWLC